MLDAEDDNGGGDGDDGERAEEAEAEEEDVVWNILSLPPGRSTAHAALL